MENASKHSLSASSLRMCTWSVIHHCACGRYFDSADWAQSQSKSDSKQSDGAVADASDTQTVADASDPSDPLTSEAEREQREAPPPLDRTTKIS